MPINRHNQTAYIFKKSVTDVSSLIPTKNGTLNSIYFDNGGTTPPFNSVVRELKQYTPWYKYVSDKSRKAKLISDLYEEGRVSIKNFVNADKEHGVVYTKNTTEAINIVSNLLCQNCEEKPVVITTSMEHFSNYLPWRFRCDVVLVDVRPDGRLSMTDLERKMLIYKDRVKMVAVVGATNVTGYVNPIHEIARLAHKYGAEVLIDAAQLIQHRTIDMSPGDPKERIDYLTFSAHKVYAPFFSGVLIGNKHVLDNGAPLCYGAGINEDIPKGSTRIVLKPSPDRYEGGSNNLLGAIALATSIQTLIGFGMDTIKKHESELLRYTVEELKKIPSVVQYGDTRKLDDRISIVSFNVSGKQPHEVAQYLYDDYGIIVKNGFCGSDFYVNILTANSPFTGVVRISMALYNQETEIDRLIKALKEYE